MDECEFARKCPMFQSNILGDEELTIAIRMNYCGKRKNSCARYQVATTAGKEFVSNSLLPFMTSSVPYILSSIK